MEEITLNNMTISQNQTISDEVVALELLKIYMNQSATRFTDYDKIVEVYKWILEDLKNGK